MQTKESNPIQMLSSDWNNYQLLDTGNRKRLEQFGDYVVIRGEPKAWWKPDLNESEWNKAVAIADDNGEWRFKKKINKIWNLKYSNLVFETKFTDMSKHLGVFPEQAPHWEWIMHQNGKTKDKQFKLLNLFGYTGAASLAGATAGFAVTHIDASKPAITWARKNQDLSNMNNAPIRWILDDANKFVLREFRRKKQYDAVILDPPSFGRGPKGEMWKAEFKLCELLKSIRNILSDTPQFVILNMYSIDASSLMLQNLLADMMKDFDGYIQPGELVLTQKSSDKILPMSIFAKWRSK